MNRPISHRPSAAQSTTPLCTARRLGGPPRLISERRRRPREPRQGQRPQPHRRSSRQCDEPVRRATGYGSTSRGGGVSNQIAPSSLRARHRGAAAVACSGDPILDTAAAAAARRAGNGSISWAAMAFDVEPVEPLGELRMVVPSRAGRASRSYAHRGRGASSRAPELGKRQHVFFGRRYLRRLRAAHRDDHLMAHVPPLARRQGAARLLRRRNGSMMGGCEFGVSRPGRSLR